MQLLCPSLVRWRGEDPLPQSKMLWKSMPPKMSVIAFFKSCCHVQGETSLYSRCCLASRTCRCLRLIVLDLVGTTGLGCLWSNSCFWCGDEVRAFEVQPSEYSKLGPLPASVL
mmetsp:Transcript_126874/g.320473  ORF Transcript_126874/g.320473 Transcript_126874/m.320473 type:complete len:113 (-) Transcript_126874:70-408(-)